MNIKILFDKKRLDNTFLTGWGLSYLIGGKVLFDTGEEPTCLFHNMKCMNVNLDDIESTVISHDHFDHTGGLWEILKQKPTVKLYVCTGLDGDFKQRAMSFGVNMMETSPFSRIGEGIYTTGQMGGMCGLDYVREQSLVLDTERGLTIVAGCAHMGISALVDRVKQEYSRNINLLIGGFHLMGIPAKKITSIASHLKNQGVQCVAPSHCSGEEAEEIFRDIWGKNFIDVSVGMTINI